MKSTELSQINNPLQYDKPRNDRKMNRHKIDEDLHKASNYILLDEYLIWERDNSVKNDEIKNARESIVGKNQELNMTEIPGMQIAQLGDDESINLLFDWSMLWYRLGSSKSARKNYFYQYVPLLHVYLEFFFSSRSIYFMICMFTYLTVGNVIVAIIDPEISRSYIYVRASLVFCLLFAWRYVICGGWFSSTLSELPG